MNPFDYSLCRDKVTIYRAEGENITRRVVDGVYLACSCMTPVENYGKSLEKKFRLIIPGNHPVECGERVYRGIGPETVDWQRFLPAVVPELFAVSYASPCFWEGEVIHWEAGNRKETV